jgi:hypothetical protein
MTQRKDAPGRPGRRAAAELLRAVGRQPGGHQGGAGRDPAADAGRRAIGRRALLLWAWSAWRGIALWQRDGTLRGGLLAGLLFAVEFGCMFVGLQYTTASRMVVFLYLAPFVVALGMPLISRSERLDRWQALGLAMAFGGVVWAFAEGLGARGPAAMAGRRAGRGRRRAVGPDHAGDARQPAGHRRAREDAALPAGHVGRWRWPLRPRCWPASPGRSAWRAVVGGAGLPDRGRHLCQLPGVVLADPPLPGHARVGLHAADPRVRAAGRRAAAGRPGDARLLLALVAVSCGIALVNRLFRRVP